MKWTEGKIVKWSREKLPDLSLRDERKKADLEANEFLQASGYVNIMEELVDYYITQVILAYRFNNPSATVVCLLFKWAFIENGDKQFTKAVDAKMDINEQRPFVKIDGEYRRVKAENEEFSLPK